MQGSVKTDESKKAPTQEASVKHRWPLTNFLYPFVIIGIFVGCHKSNQKQESTASTSISSVVKTMTPRQRDLLALLDRTPPAAWPQKPSCAPGVLSAMRLRSLLGPEATSALTCFTEGSCADIHTADALADGDLVARGYPQNRIAELRKMSQQIHLGLRRAPKSNMPAYRVIKSVSPEHVAGLMEFWHDRLPIGLGEEFRPALASASWDTSLLEKRLSKDPNPNFHLLYVIKGHQGVPIETLSPFPAEHEVLIPKDETFKIESIAPLAEKKGVLRIDLSGH